MPSPTICWKGWCSSTMRGAGSKAAETGGNGHCQQLKKKPRVSAASGRSFSTTYLSLSRICRTAPFDPLKAIFVSLLRGGTIVNKHKVLTSELIEDCRQRIVHGTWAVLPHSLKSIWRFVC